VNDLIDIVLLTFLAVTAVAIIRLRNLLAVVMLSGIYSLLSAAFFVVLDAVDVSFTEAAVGAGISTMLMLATLALTGSQEKPPSRRPWLPLAVVVLTGAVLVYGTLDMPRFGDPRAPVQRHVAPVYLKGSEPLTGVPNVVTAVLGSFRGYDTLGETVVIFTAGTGVVLLLGSGARRRGRKAVGKGERT